MNPLRPALWWVLLWFLGAATAAGCAWGLTGLAAAWAALCSGAALVHAAGLLCAYTEQRVEQIRRQGV